jgi:hypothetical protein
MRLAILSAILVFGIAGEALAYDAKGQGAIVSPLPCSYYLDAYSKTTLTGQDESHGPYEWWAAKGWIAGYLSGYNMNVDNGKSDIVAGISYNDTYRWVASWCRDNPSKSLFDAVNALIINRK